jgi:diadenylate cyclase
MPLSASGVLTRSPERRMGLRHRAALGISEVSDAVAVVVSEETGVISVVHGGRMIRRLDAERLENILRAFYRPLRQKRGMAGLISRLMPSSQRAPREEI